MLTRTEVPQGRPQPHSPQHSATASSSGWSRLFKPLLQRKPRVQIQPRVPTLDLTTMPRHGITTVVQQLSPTIGEAAATYSSDTLTRTEVPQERPQPHSPQHSATASTFGSVPAVQAPTAEETTGAISASRVPLQAQRHSITAAHHTLRAVAAAADGEESSGGTPSAPTLGLTTMPRHGIITVVQQLSPTIGEAAITYSSGMLTRIEVPQERPQPHSPQHSATASTSGCSRLFKPLLQRKPRVQIQHHESPCKRSVTPSQQHITH